MKKILFLSPFFLSVLGLLTFGCAFLGLDEDDPPDYVGTWYRELSPTVTEILIINESNFLVKDVPLDYAQKGELSVSGNTMTMIITHHWDISICDSDSDSQIDDNEWVIYNGEEGPATNILSYSVSGDILTIDTYQYTKQ